MKIQTLVALSALAVAPAFAQLAAPNAAGVAFGHVHLNASDVDAQVKFWAMVGGNIVQREKITMAQFPGGYILIRKQDYKGGSVGSTINHIGLYVRDFEPAVAKWKAAGLKWEPVTNPNVGQGFLTGPDDVRIEIYENKALATPMAIHHIHLFVSDPLEAQKWYVQNFGATAGKRGMYDTANVPGAEITLAKSEPQAPTKGRSVDHIGFEVKNIDAFVAKLKAAGIKTDADIRNSANASGLRIVYITDPWGTEIEITQGLSTPVQVASR
jgi:catechol 2,3-dioxygenase-like lactoylglutathione lyase family enzyme